MDGRITQPITIANNFGNLISHVSSRPYGLYYFSTHIHTEPPFLYANGIAAIKRRPLILRPQPGKANILLHCVGCCATIVASLKPRTRTTNAIETPSNSFQEEIEQNLDTET